MNIAAIFCSILAVLALALGGYFAYDNSLKVGELENIETQAQAEARGHEQKISENEDTFAQLTTRIEEELNPSIEEATEHLDGLTEQKNELNEQDRQIASRLSEAKSTIAEVRNQLDQIGDMNQAVEGIDEVRNRLASITSKKQAAETRIAQADSRSEANQQRIRQLQELEQAQKSGKIPGGLTTRVSSYLSDYNVAVIAAGANQNVNVGTNFSLRRGGQELARGKVTTIYPNQAVVSLSSTRGADSVVQAGDTAVYLGN